MEDILELIVHEETKEKYERLTEQDQRYLSKRIDGFMRGEVDGHRRGPHQLRSAQEPEALFEVYLEIGFTNVFTEIAHSYIAVKPEQCYGLPESLKNYCMNYDVDAGEYVGWKAAKAARFVNAHRKYGTGEFEDWFMSFLEPELRTELQDALTWKV